MSFHNDQAYSLEFRLYERYLTVYVYVNLYIPTADAYVQSKLSVMQKKFYLFKHWSLCLRSNRRLKQFEELNLCRNDFM